MLDPIAEMLTRIRNAQRAGKREVLIEASNLKLAIARVLEKEGFIESVAREKEDKEDKIERIKINLKYYPLSLTKKAPAIRQIRRVSREGQRIYVKHKDIRSIKNSFGISILSTSKGIMTGDEARKVGLGGEYICEVW